MDQTLHIREAGIADAARLLEIYEPYVKDTAITFETEVPKLEEFGGRITEIRKKYPYLVAEQEGRIIGYAYASAFHPRAAYAWNVETSIYLDMEARRQGAGRLLYEALEDALRRMGVLNLNACIASPEKEDEHLTRNSIQFHEHMGFSLVGEFHHSGFKFGRWYNMVWMEKLIGVHDADPAPVIPYPALPASDFASGKSEAGSPE